MIMPDNKYYAPGAPGIKAKWTSSTKSGIGKALNTLSDVAFSLSHGIVNEIYFPREDIACTRDMELIVTDGNNFFSEEKRDTTHDIRMLKPGIPAYEIVNTCKQNKYRITKEIITDPIRNTFLQKIQFDAAASLATPHLYIMLAPHLGDEGDHNNGWTGEYKGVPMLFAQYQDLCLAMASSAKWLKRSVGYVGHSDGWTDIHAHNTMEWEYTNANNGNIALTGEINLDAGAEILLAVGFGRNPYEAANHARGSILEGFKSAKRMYLHGWQTWLKSLSSIPGKNMKISSSILRMHEAKTFPGGIIASLSIPWGNIKGDSSKGGYHVVWPRDLVESAGGFMALHAEEDALRILTYLMSTQNADGSWPQNMWLEGSPHWTGMQMDQVALPILLMYKCFEEKSIDRNRMRRYWPLVKKSLAFLVVNGPYSQQDRWEEEKGYSQFTLAAEIAGLLAGADLADLNNEKELATYCRETADAWNELVENRTYVTGTELAGKYGVDGYYIRINPYSNMPANELGDRSIHLKNHHNGDGQTKLTDLVSVDALSLVRFGLREPGDPRITNTVKIIDALLKVDTPNGPCWHRYNNDGYGETEEGDPYDGAGIGRAWPLLSGERGHYEIARGNIEGAKNLLKAMDGFANNGLLSEQIWDSDDIPEKHLYRGQHSGSAMPLTWAHSEYIKLCASIKARKVYDMPKQTRERYLEQKKRSDIITWRFNSMLKKIELGKTLRIETMAKTKVTWTDDAWQNTYTAESKDSGIGIFVTDIRTTSEKASAIDFTFYWEESAHWENKNYSVEIIRNDT